MKALAHPLVATYLKTVAGQTFSPRWWGVLVNPYFTSRRLLHAEIRRLSHQMTGPVLLDIGCGSTPYRPLFSARVYIGLDLPRAALHAGTLDAAYDGQHLPILDGRADHAIMTEVLEHVFEPIDVLVEIRRVLRPGGTLLLTVPFAWSEHEQPFDYARYTSFGLRYLLEHNGFTIVQIRKTGGRHSALSQLLVAGIEEASRSWHFAIRAAVVAVVCAPLLAVGLALDRLHNADPDLYLDTVVLARKATHAPRVEPASG